MRNKFIVSLIISAALILGIATVPFAADNWNYNPTGNIISITGVIENAPANIPVTLLILKPQIAIDDIDVQNPGDSILHMDITLTDSLGGYSFLFTLDENDISMNLFIRVNSTYFQIPDDGTVRYISASELESIVADLGNANSPQEFIDILLNDGDGDGFTLGDDLGINLETYTTLPSDAQERIRNNIFKTCEDMDENDIINSVSTIMEAYRLALIVEEINAVSGLQSLESYASTYEGDLNLDTDEFELIEESNKEKFFTEFKKNLPVANIEELKNVFERSATLVFMNYTMDQSLQMEQFISAYKDDLNLDIGVYNQVTNKSLFHARLLQQRPYSSLDAFKDYFNEYAETVVANQGNSGPATGSSLGGGGGGGGSVVKPNTQIPAPIINVNITSVFNDISDVSWAHSYIQYLYECNIINGDGYGRFRPNDQITREEFVKMIVSAFGFEKKGMAAFEDADKDAWYSNYIDIAYSNDIISGISDTIFGIGRAITREEIAIICARVAKATGKQLPATLEDIIFIDANHIAGYALESVNALTKAGILSGYEDKTFRPNNAASRAESAKILGSLLNCLN